MTDETVLQVGGMTCDGCVNAVTRVLSKVPGVDRAMVDLQAGQAHIQGGAAPEALVAAVQRAGYEARVA